MYHFCNGVKAMRDAHEVGSFEEFAESFMRGDVFYGPYFQNLKSYWKRRDDANILLLRYEDLSKIIYVYRNIKDVCVSMYHFCNGVKAMRDAHEVGSFEEFAESFMRGDVFYGPYFQNLKSYWKRRDDANILLLRYEDLSKNPHQNVSKLATFLDRKLDVDQVNDIVRRTSFEEMKKLDDSYDTKTRGNEEFDESYRFIRSGQPEQWKSHFTPSLLNKMNSWIAENLSTEELANFDGS
ncbi:putative Estrogen sulfotransferase [Hypsibius exemplaris]|uniref:Estrogen sulfotransferase n=1 Tax=Hypsibius exemplaris TaxID=2072580 RepID=A0A1W0WHA0_HYPEX|nr:putative Estrogen sulfotransferase [Hypsibius exemplaris]